MAPNLDLLEKAKTQFGMNKVNTMNEMHKMSLEIETVTEIVRHCDDSYTGHILIHLEWFLKQFFVVA